MIKVFKKQPLEAEKFDGSRNMIDRYGIIDAGTMSMINIHSDQLYLPFNSSIVQNGDWIVSNMGEDPILIKDKEFDKSYRQLPEIPKGVAEYIELAKQDEEVTNVIIAAMGAIEFDQSNIVVSEWIQANGDDFAQAWLTGYTTMEG